MSTLVAVLDIGKTNKKIALYDEALTEVAFREHAFEAAPGDDGIAHEPVTAMWEWFTDTLAELFREHPFSAIAVSTHGATVTALDADGELSMPVIAYDQPLGAGEQAALDDELYRLAGGQTAVQAETGGCDLPLLINPSKMLLFAKSRYPEGFARTVRLLNYPQYWGFRLTGEQAAEPTFSCNHTHLYTIADHRPSRCAAALGVDHMLLRRLRRPWDRLGILSASLQFELGLPPLPVAVGIHDSNAALLPYLLKHRGRDFLLNSTGTWCVAMHGVDAPVYREHELGRKILFNVDALGGYQKVAFLMGGQEYARYHELIGGEHGDFDPARMDAALAEPADRILPGAFPSQFPDLAGGATDSERRYSLDQLDAGERPAWFAERTRAHDLLNASLALQTRVAFDAAGIGEDTAIFIEGGFRDNASYCALLAALYPDRTVACTGLAHATCVGTALLAHSLVSGGTPFDYADRLTIDEHPIAAPELPSLAAYADAFLR